MCPAQPWRRVVNLSGPEQRGRVADAICVAELRPLDVLKALFL